jgi:hypothetical protein
MTSQFLEALYLKDGHVWESLHDVEYLPAIVGSLWYNVGLLGFRTNRIGFRLLIILDCSGQPWFGLRIIDLGLI